MNKKKLPVLKQNDFVVLVSDACVTINEYVKCFNVNEIIIKIIMIAIIMTNINKIILKV